MMLPVVFPPHSRSMREVFSMGKLPWIAREMRGGCSPSIPYSYSLLPDMNTDRGVHVGILVGLREELGEATWLVGLRDGYVVELVRC